jgi:hypothetical protein
MAKQHMPRPWLLAALADVPVAILAQHEAKESDTDRREHRLPRAETRRRRLSARHFADQWPDEWYGEDCWRGAGRWHDLESERVN